MKLLIIACLVAAASALPRTRLGAEKCTWGPSYWCKNYKQAVECEAVEHCRKQVWKSEDPCSDCKMIVGKLHDYAVNNKTELLVIMKNICGELGTLADQCKSVVGLYGQTVISELVELTADSEKLCQDLEMCSKAKQGIRHTMKAVFIRKLKQHRQIKQYKSVKADYCEDCKLAFAEVKDILNDKDVQTDLIHLLEEACAELPSIASQCKSYVDAYAALVFDEASSLIDPASLCSELGVCNTTVKVITATPLRSALSRKLFFPMAPGPVVINTEPVKKPKKLGSPKSGPYCAVCELLMKELDGILGENATKEEIEEALEEVCDLMPYTLKSDCKDVVSEYGPKIITLLLQDLQPSEICTQLGFCSTTTRGAVAVSVNTVSLRNSGSGEYCEICKLAIQALQSELKTNSTEEEIKKELEEICSLLPPSIKTECDSIVSQYGDLIIKLILGEISPEEVCQALGLCTSGKNTALEKLCSLGESFRCASEKNARMCKHLIVARKFKLGKDKKIDHENICKFLQYFKRLEPQDAVRMKGKAESQLCMECIYAVKYLGNLFPKNTSKETILNGLKAACSRFQPYIAEACDDLVNRYGNLLVRILLGQVDPQKFCESLKLCGPSKISRKNVKLETAGSWSDFRKLIYSIKFPNVKTKK